MKERCPTGIKGFDELIEGGFPKGASVLYAGSPGTGKTIFGIEFLYRGAANFEEKGLYVTFEQTAEEIRNQAEQFGWNIQELETKGLLEIMAVPSRKIDPKTVSMIIRTCQKKDIKRLVIDSLSTLSINAPIFAQTNDIVVKSVINENVFFSPPVVGELLVKRFIYAFIDDLKRLSHTTTLLISETPNNAEYMSRDTISEFLCDGVILITFESMGGEYSRSLIVRKMRQTKNDEDIHPLEISPQGLVVHTIE